MNDPSRLGAAVGPPLSLAPVRPADLTPALLIGAAVFAFALAWRMSLFPSEARHVVYPVGAGILYLLFAWFFLYLRNLERGVLALYERGLVWARSGKTVVLTLDEIESLAVREVDWTSDGGSKGLWRQIVARGSTGRIWLRNTALKDQPDLVGSLLNDLLDRLAAMAEARLRSGIPLTGEGWSLGIDGFRGGGEKNAALPVATADLARVERIKKKAATKKIALWRRGEDRPFFTVRSKGPNALVLARVLERGPHPQPLSQPPSRTAGRGES